MAKSIHQKGSVTLGAVIVVFFAALAIAVSIQFAGIGEILSGARIVESERAFALADSCFEEALLRLSRDDAYAGGTLSAGSDSCTIAVTGSGGTRSITVSASAGLATRQVTAGISLSGGNITIDSWQEELS